MKEFKFLIPVAAIFAVGVFTTSCSDDNSAVEVKTLEVNRTHDLTLTSNVEAKFAVEGQEVQTGTSATFTDLSGKSVKVTVTAADADFVIPANSQTMTVNFTDEKIADSFNFTFAKVSANQLGQDAAKGEIVTNDAENASFFNSVSLAIPEDVAITGNTTDPFSVVAYVPTEAEVREVTNGNTTTANVTLLAVQGAPYNGHFSPALIMKVYLNKDLAGMKVTVNDNEYVVDNEGYVSFTAPHFADVYRIEGGVEFKKVLTDGWETISSEIVNCKAAPTPYTYTVNKGWEQISGDEISNDAKSVVNKVPTFGGEYGSTKKQTVIPTKQAGPRTVVIKQLYNDYEVRYNGYEFVARVWGKAEVAISDIHSGGSGK